MMSYPDLLDENIVAFGRALRSKGLQVGFRELDDALKAFQEIDVTDRGDFFNVLRTLFPRSPQEQEQFDQFFEWYFGGNLLDGNFPSDEIVEHQEKIQNPVPRFSLGLQSRTHDAETQKEVRRGSYSPLELVSRSPERMTELQQLNQIVRQLARKLSQRQSRRKRSSFQGHVPDIRLTIQRSIKRSGELMELVFKRRRLERIRLVILMDVSGSMEPNSQFFYQFAHACLSQRGLGRVEVFAFSTQLYRLTRALQIKGIRKAEQALICALGRRSTGTRIGFCFEKFLHQYKHNLRRDTVVLVLSDGWDTGNLELLDQTLVRMKRYGILLFWFNPLAGSQGYEPTTSGMRVILPHTDVCAPVIDLESLRRFKDSL